MKTLFQIIILVFVLISCEIKNSSQRNAPEYKREQVSANETERMSYIPAGTFVMGGKSEEAYTDEFPKHKVSVGAFYMDKTEVTNQQFAEFVEATGYITLAERDLDWNELKKQLPEDTPAPADSLLKAGALVFKQTSGPVNLSDYSQWWEWKRGANWRHPEGLESDISDKYDHPVVHVTLEDAKAYASWSGKRLPTEAEWEWAAMGGRSNAKYPWGNESVDKAYDKANFWQGLFPHENRELDGFPGSSPVGAFPANGYGLFDMAGNVWEWCQDKYDVDTYSKLGTEIVDPQGSDSYNDPREPNALKHVTRGGSFLCNDSYCSGYRTARRMGSDKDSGLNHIGFRCVRDIN